MKHSKCCGFIFVLAVWVQSRGRIQVKVFELVLGELSGALGLVCREELLAIGIDRRKARWVDFSDDRAVISEQSLFPDIKSKSTNVGRIRRSFAEAC